MTNDGLYLLKSDTPTIKTLNSGALGADYSFDDDKEAGYYKDAVGDYFTCDNKEDSNGTSIRKCYYLKNIPTDGCNDSNVGKLVKDGSKVGLCLAYYKIGETEYTPLLEFIPSTVTAGSNPNLTEVQAYTYFVQHREKDSVSDVNRIMNFNDKANYYAIKRKDYNKILFDYAYSK